MVAPALWAFLGVAGQQFARLFVVVALARLLTPEAFGIVATAQVILSFSEVIMNFGVTSALIHQHKTSGQTERSVATIVCAMTLAICGVLYASCDLISNLLYMPELAATMPLLLVGFALRGLCSTSVTLLNRDLRFRRLTGIEIVSYILGYACVSITLAAWGYSYWALIIANVCQAAIYAGWALLSRPVFPTLTVRWVEISPLLRFGSGMLISQILNNIALRADNLIVASTMGATVLGYYSRAYTIMDMANSTLGTVFYKVLFPSFSKIRSDGVEPASTHSLFNLSHGLAALVVIPLSALIWLCASEIVLILLGKGWEQVVPVLKILVLGMYFRLAYKISGAFVAAEGAVYRQALQQLLYALLVVAGTYAGVHFGLVAVAWAILLALGWQWYAQTALALRLGGMSWSSVWISVAPAAVTGLASTAFASYTVVLLQIEQYPAILRLTISGSILISVYLVGLAAVSRVWSANGCVGPQDVLRPITKALRRRDKLRGNPGGRGGVSP